MAEGGPPYAFLIHISTAVTMSAGERRGGGVADTRRDEDAPASGFQGHSADGVAPVLPRQLRPLLSRPLLRGPGSGRCLIALPQTVLGVGLAQRGRTTPSHGVRYQAERADALTSPPGGLSIGCQGGRPLFLHPLLSQWSVPKSADPAHPGRRLRPRPSLVRLTSNRLSSVPLWREP